MDRSSGAIVKYSQSELIDRLSQRVYLEHVNGCGQCTCDINAAYEQDYVLWAIELFKGCGATSDHFDSLYSQLDKSFRRKAENERKNFVANTPHCECNHCGAILWLPEDHDYFCDSCAKQVTRPIEVQS